MEMTQTLMAFDLGEDGGYNWYRRIKGGWGGSKVNVPVVKWPR